MQNITLKFTVECGRGNLTMKHKVPFKLIVDFEEDEKLVQEWLQDKARRAVATVLEQFTDEELIALIEEVGVISGPISGCTKKKNAMYQSPKAAAAKAVADAQKAVADMNKDQARILFEQLQAQFNL